MKVYSIEATNMGNNQEEIASKVEDYTDGVDFETEDAFCNMEGELITRACNDLGWGSVPQTGGLIANWDR